LNDTLAEGVIERRVRVGRLNAEARGLVAVNDDRELGTAGLLV
jgi:hypothetical protein